MADPPTYAGPLLDVVDLKTWFQTPRGVVKAVDGVSFSLARGRTLGVVGESGSGKSVLARTIMGLNPIRTTIPAGGKVVFEGHDIMALRPSGRRRLWGARMAMIFQDPMTSLNPVMKVGRQITESLKLHLRMGGMQARQTAVELLRSVGIPEPVRRLREYPHQLSGGMRQRVTIAIALSCGPSLLLADEPTTALDVTVQAQILDLLRSLQQDRGMALMLITHDLGVVAGRTDDTVVMYAGEIVERAATATLFRNMRHPYTEALFLSIPRLKDPSHTRLLTIPGGPPDPVNFPPGCRFAPRCRYAQPRCIAETPPLAGSDTYGHDFACFYPVGSDAGREALARNEAAGHTAAGTPTEAVAAGGGGA